MNYRSFNYQYLIIRIHQGQVLNYYSNTGTRESPMFALTNTLEQCALINTN